MNLRKWIGRLVLAGVLFAMMVPSLMSQGTQESKGQVVSAETLIKHQMQGSNNSSVLNKKISLKLKQTTLLEALRIITEKGKLKLSYDTQLPVLDKKLTMNIGQVTIKEALWKVLDNTGLRFAVSSNDQLILMKRGKDRLLELVQETITGTVTDAQSGDALPGVNILVKGTSTGASTNADGAFELTVESLQDTLVVSYIGYQTKEVLINGRTEIDIELASQTIAGEEMVVIGYGTQKKSDLTGSVSSVDAEGFEGRNMSSLEEGLQGQAAGISVVGGSGQPGGRTMIRIRGQNSVLGGNDPLYVVDGVPIQSGNEGNTSMLSTINPGDIESIEILKDASATAIYGARGSNGVVLITTKHGSSGKNLIEFESSLGVSKVIKKIDMMDSKQFVELANERAINDGQSLYFPNPETAAKINTDWQDEIFRTGLSQNHSIRFSGGDEETQYYISGNFSEQEGSIIGTEFTRGAFRINLDQKVGSRLNLSSQLTISKSQANRTTTEQSGGILFSALGLPPVESPQNEDGSYTLASDLYDYGFSSSSGDNPLIIANERLNRLNTTRLLGNIRGSYEIRDDLSFDIMLGMDQLNNQQDNYSSRMVRKVPDGSASQMRNKSINYVIESLINYNNDFGEHSINAVGGFTWEGEQSDFISGSSQGFVTDDFKSNNLSAGERYDQPNTGISSADIISFLGRVNYTFQNKYLFTVTGRRDGSSRFGKENKWAFFPSAAVAWRLSDENFIKQIEQITDLKLRFSWGKTGNQAISTYQSLQQFSPQALAFGNTNVIGYAPSNLGSPNLKWETVEQLNLGLDLGLFSDRLRMSLNLYQKNTTDLLARVNLPPSSGFATTLQNIGAMENRGIEFDLTWDVIRGKDLFWDVNFNISSNNNKVTKLAGGADVIAPQLNILGSANIVREGEPLSSFYGYEQDGLTEDGLFNYVDQNNDGEINPEDRVILGNPYPDFEYGFSTALNYHNLNLSILVQGNQGKELWNNNKNFHSDSFDGGLNQVAAAVDRWTPSNPNTDAPYPKATNSLNKNPSDWYIEDASFIRLKNVKLSYNIPSESLPVRSVRVFVSGDNLLTFTNYSWFNPDVNAFESGDLRAGIDMNTYPISKTIMLGLNVGL